MIKISRKYSLLSKIINVLVTGICPSINVLKKLTKSAIKGHEQDCFLISIFFHRSLSMYQECIMNVKIWPYWQLTKFKPKGYRLRRIACRLMFEES